jgi:hypothetical protein
MVEDAVEAPKETLVPTYSFLATPKPPAVLKAPVVEEEESVVSVPTNVGRVTVPVKVGDAAKTKAPLPVSSVIAELRLALEGVARKVAMPEPRPETPVEMGRPVQLVKVPEVGVPRTGAVSVGEFIVGELKVLFVRVWVPPSLTIVPVPEV